MSRVMSRALGMTAENLRELLVDGSLREAGDDSLRLQ
jgi:hypothetical protein